MYDLGEGWGLVPEGCNPCRSVAKYPERKRERFLTDAEFARLGQVLDEAVTLDGASRLGVASIQLLILTGCRKSEILTLRWKDVDLDAGELDLADTPTDGRVVPLGPEARAVLKSLPSEGDNPCAIAGKLPGSHLTDLQRPWRRIRERAGLEDVRIHDLRHSCASYSSNPL